MLAFAFMGGGAFGTLAFALMGARGGAGGGGDGGGEKMVANSTPHTGFASATSLPVTSHGVAAGVPEMQLPAIASGRARSKRKPHPGLAMHSAALAIAVHSVQHVRGGV